MCARQDGDDEADAESEEDPMTTVWRVATVHPGEQLRWTAPDGRWVALASGHGISAGAFLVTDSQGRCESAKTREDALALARRWRT
jgi:hypothetical protein